MAILLFGCGPSTDPSFSKNLDLHETSQQIVETHKKKNVRGIDLEAVTQSIYEKVRPIVLINNKNLSPAEIDQITRDYIRTRYAPAIIGNYALLYKTMRKADLDFHSCKKPQFFSFGENSRATLCIGEASEKEISVKYLSDPFNQGPKETAVFYFYRKNKMAFLSKINFDTPGIKSFYVEGV